MSDVPVLPCPPIDAGILPGRTVDLERLDVARHGPGLWRAIGHDAALWTWIPSGPFPTEGMSARLNPGQQQSAYENMSGNPMNRVGEMAELANLAVYLLSKGSEYVNGQTIAIDGGQYNASGGNFSRMTEWGDDQWQAVKDMIKATNEKDRAQRTV